MTEHEHHHASHGKPHGPAAPHEPAKTPPDLPSAAGVIDLQKQLEAKTREAVELLDQLKRVAAEYSNYQKRMQRHLEEEKNLAVRALVLDLLPALDNFDRALAATGGQFKPETLLEGVTLVHQQLLAALARHGVKPIDAGATFDPEHHEAVACLPSETHAQGQVIEQLQRGYQLHGRTIRPAHVAVSGGSSSGETQETNEDSVEPPS